MCSHRRPTFSLGNAFDNCGWPKLGGKISTHIIKLSDKLPSVASKISVLKTYIALMLYVLIPCKKKNPHLVCNTFKAEFRRSLLMPIETIFTLIYNSGSKCMWNLAKLEDKSLNKDYFSFQVNTGPLEQIKISWTNCLLKKTTFLTMLCIRYSF